MPPTATGAGISVTSLDPGSTIRLILVSAEDGQTQTSVHGAVLAAKSDSGALELTLRGLLKSLPKTPYKLNLNYPLYVSKSDRAKVAEAIRKQKVHLSSEIDNEGAYSLSVRPWKDHSWQNNLFLDIGQSSSIARISISEVEEGIRDSKTVAEASKSNGETHIDADQILAQLVDPVLAELQATPSAAGGSLHSAIVIASSPTDVLNVVELLRLRLPGIPIHRVMQADLAQAAAQHVFEMANQPPVDLSLCFVSNVAPLRIGIAKADGFVHTLIPRHFTLPNHRSCIFTTSSDNQTTATIKVIAGESAMIEDNKVIAELVLKDIAPQPKGVPRIRVTIDVQQLGETEVIAEVVHEADSVPAPKATIQLKYIVGDMTVKEIEQYSNADKDEIRDDEAEKAGSLRAGTDVQGELSE